MTKELIVCVNFAAHNSDILTEAAVVNDIGAVDISDRFAVLGVSLDVTAAVAVTIDIALLEIVAVLGFSKYYTVIFVFGVHSFKFLKVDNRV